MIQAVEKNQSYAAQAYSTLKHAIITNGLKPGEVLNERDLSARLDVSRTPLREALQLLQKDGWLISQGKNKVVTPVTWQDVEEIYALRVANEALALDLLAKSFSDEKARQMEAMLNEMKELMKSDTVEYLERDKSFHLYLAELSGNGRLHQLMKSITEQFIRISYVMFRNGSLRLGESYQEHLEIYEACRSGDFERAKAASRRHLAAWYAALKDHWEER